ncbi:MAG: hypothetical protein VB065_11575 [Eubacteriales bacterium]|nr:hypothetical protein [Christensenellaceae bacterium]MEA5066681.1 hypothetical protein [Eubacteriales bacterium]
MGNARGGLRSGLYSLRRMLTKPQLYMALATMFLFLESDVSMLYAFTRDYELRMNVWGFIAMVLSNPYYGTIVSIGAIVLFADAPFYDEMQQDILCRIGQKKWITGQILYVFAGTAIYMGLLFAMKALLLAPYVEFGNDWGDALSTIVYTSVAQEYAAMDFYEIILEEFTPLSAFFLSTALRMAVIVTCVLSMFAINTASRTKYGAAAAVFILLLDVTDFLPRVVRRLSISTLARLSAFDYGYSPGEPTLPLAIGVLVGCLIVSIGVVVAIGRRFDVADLLNRG